MLTKFDKAIMAAVGAAVMFAYDKWGEVLSLPPNWPEIALAVLTPVAVWALRNKD